MKSFRKGWAHATASVRITNVAWFIAGLTLLASSGGETKKARETAITVLSANTRPAKAHARYRMTRRVEGSCLITSARLTTTTRANIPVSNLKIESESASNYFYLFSFSLTFPSQPRFRAYVMKSAQITYNKECTRLLAVKADHVT